MEQIEPARKRRRRPPKSCEQCRSRKVRCDQKSPCNQCIKTKIENCTYSVDAVVLRPANPTRFGNINQAPPTPAASVSRDSVSQHHGHDPASSLIHSPEATNLVDLRGEDRSFHLADVLDNRRLHELYPDTTKLPNTTSSSIHGALHGTVTKTRLLGKSHWINVVQEFTFVKGLQKRLEENDSLNLNLLQRLEKCKSLGRSIKGRSLAELKNHASIRDVVPSKEVADILVADYFRAFESCYRVLHVPSFQREYESYWQNPETASTTFVAKLLVVLAIGTCVNEGQSMHDRRISALQWINAVQSWTNSPFTEKSRLSVSGIQIYCLLLLARETNSVSPDLVWISAGSLLRTAMLIGLHRDPIHFQRLTPFQSEIRRRLWATVMEICLQSSMNAGGSPMVSIEIHDCRPPSNIDDEDLDEKGDDNNKPKDDNVFTQSSLQIALMQTMSIRSRIASILNDFRADQPFSDILQIGAKLSESLRQISIRLKRSRADPNSLVNDTGYRAYELMTYRFLMSLHQTYTIKAFADPMFYFSRKVCLDTSLLIVSASFSLSSSLSQGRKENQDCKNIIEVASGTPKNVIMLACLFISLELVHQLQNRELTPPSVADDLLRDEMFRALDAYCEWTLARVKMGETNVKGYLFALLGMANLKGLALGPSSEEIAIKDGDRGLNECLEILEQRLSCFQSIDPPNPVDDQIGGDFYVPFDEEFGWDDWGAKLNFESLDFFIPQF